MRRTFQAGHSSFVPPLDILIKIRVLNGHATVPNEPRMGLCVLVSDTGDLGRAYAPNFIMLKMDLPPVSHVEKCVLELSDLMLRIQRIRREFACRMGHALDSANLDSLLHS